MSSGPLPKVALRHYAMAHGGCPHRSSEGVPPHYCFGWQPTAAGGQCTMPAPPAADGNTCVRPLGAALVLPASCSVLPFLQHLPRSFVWRAFATGLWLYHPGWLRASCQRGGACSHDGLALQTAVHGSLGCRGAPVLAACIAQLMRVRRHCSAAAGPLCCLLWCAPLGS